MGAVLSIAAMFLFACASKQSSSSTQTITSEVKAQLTMSPDQLEGKIYLKPIVENVINYMIVVLFKRKLETYS